MVRLCFVNGFSLWLKIAALILGLRGLMAVSAQAFTSSGQPLLSSGLVVLALVLAVFNQAGGSTSLLNYAPEVFERAGVGGDERAMELAAAVSGMKAIGIVIGARSRLHRCFTAVLLLTCEIS